MKYLRDIRAVTHSVADLDAETAAWTELLGYTVVHRGNVEAAQGLVWDAPADTGNRCALLQPASGAPVFLRLVETGEREGYWPPVTWGWNATEILVEDPDALAAKLEGSAFRRFGGPGDLYAHPKAPRAIQTYAPSGAMVYFTRITPGGSRYGLHGARSPVDRIFNVVLGGPSLDKLGRFYGETLGLRVGEPMPFTMTLAAQACGASPDTLFPICVAPLRARTSILELDEYPDNTQPRKRPAGCIPGGMSIVTCSTPSLDAFPVPFRAPPLPLDSAPYEGRRVAVIEGPAGEWVELIEEPVLRR